MTESYLSIFSLGLFITIYLLLYYILSNNQLRKQRNKLLITLGESTGFTKEEVERMTEKEINEVINKIIIK